MPHRLTYAGVPLDRAGDLRSNENWINEQLMSDNARLLVTWRDLNLIVSGSEPDAILIQKSAVQELLHQTSSRSSPIFLGQGHRYGQEQEQGEEYELYYFSLDLSFLEEEDALRLTGHTPDQAGFIDLRNIGSLLSHDTGSMLAMARALAYWHKRHMFCGTCGAPTLSHTAGHVRVCSNPDCRLEHFPRTDPAVIMLVTTTMDGEEHCLLGRQSTWVAGTYSSLAGFVEPGESLETAVLREVFEEAGIRATQATYQASQPWPFPSSLMLGFRARALTHEIDISSNELEDARWFSHSEIVELSKRDNENRVLSRGDSIASWLIHDWIKNP